ncbi:MAG: DUF2946 domain-containing protein [Rhodoferax sp.]|nr:DUF2946 domain-containing protein [Rhodoferax sp.]
MRATPYRIPLCRPWAVWLAVLIAVFGAIAPTVSHARMLAAGHLPQGVEICTSQGPRWVAADTMPSPDGPAPTQRPTINVDHCPFCLQTTDRVAPVPHLLPYLFSVQGGQQEAPVWQAFFYAATHTFTPPPRGPPGFF